MSSPPTRRLLAKHGVALAEIAEKKGVLLNYEAAVAGGIPVIKTMREAMAGNTMSRVFGILNGTCNYILTRMEAEGLSFDACLKDAQRLGYAEADPTFDIEGHDTAHKLSILTSLAFGTAIAADDIYIEGISNITPGRHPRRRPNSATASSCSASPSGPKAASSSACIRPWCRPLRSSRRCTASPMRWRSRPIFSASCCCSGPAPAATPRHRPWSATSPTSPRAGRASSTVRCSAGRRRSCSPTRRRRCAATRAAISSALTVHDRIGVFAAIAKRMADNEISLESIVQHAAGPGAAAQKTVILVTHETTEAAVRKAVDGITKDGHLTDKPQVIRIERRWNRNAPFAFNRLISFRVLENDPRVLLLSWRFDTTGAPLAGTHSAQHGCLPKVTYGQKVSPAWTGSSPWNWCA